MNSNFNDEQIKAYAAAFEEGDAIWCNGEWHEVVENEVNGDSRLTAHVDGNIYVINDGQSGTHYGFKVMERSKNPYRVTTLEDYELQGDEKIVWLGESCTARTFGKTYKTFVNEVGRVVYRFDDGSTAFQVVYDEWGIIPRYEQVKHSVDPTKKKLKFKVGDIINFKGSDIPVTISGINSPEEVPGAYTYDVKFDSGNISTYWESDLELAEESSKTTLTEKVNEVVNVKMHEQSTEVNFNEVAIHSEIITRLVKQTIKGVKKYGDPVQHNNLSAVEWIDHAIDESIDQIVYLTALKQSLMSKGDEK